jgi:NAD(P)-dependent dehydrogenase (short-subunit alcohol dehydrogenase family)
MQRVILITGASSGFGAMSARALADAGHVVYASMRDTAGRNAPQVEESLREKRCALVADACPGSPLLLRPHHSSRYPGGVWRI